MNDNDAQPTSFEHLPVDMDSNEGIRLLVTRIDASLTAMDATDAEFIEGRAGSDSAEPQSFEELARRRGVTRQRAQQIEVSLLAKIKRAGGPGMQAAADMLTQEFTRLGCFVTAGRVERLDSPGVGPTRGGRFYAAVLSLLYPDMPVWFRLPFSRGRAPDVERRLSNRLDEILELRGGEVPGRMGMFGALAFVPGATILDFRNAVTGNDKYEVVPGDKDIVASGGASDRVIRARRVAGKVGAMQVLEQADGILSIDEISARARQMFGDRWDMDERSLENALLFDRVDVFLLGSGRRYGLRRHIRLPADRWSVVAGRFYDAIRGAGHPMGASDFLMHHADDLSEVDQHELAAIAHMDGRFVQTGKKALFDLRERGGDRAPEQKDVVLDVLAAAGRSLSTEEVLELCRQRRSIADSSLPAILKDLYRAGRVARTHLGEHFLLP